MNGNEINRYAMTVARLDSCLGGASVEESGRMCDMWYMIHGTQRDILERSLEKKPNNLEAKKALKKLKWSNPIKYYTNKSPSPYHTSAPTEFCFDDGLTYIAIILCFCMFLIPFLI